MIEPPHEKAPGALQSNQGQNGIGLEESVAEIAPLSIRNQEEAQLIHGVVTDSSGFAFDRYKAIPEDAFSDYSCRRFWGNARKLERYSDEELIRIPGCHHFFDPAYDAGLSGMGSKYDGLAAKIIARWLHRTGSSAFTTVADALQGIGKGSGKKWPDAVSADDYINVLPETVECVVENILPINGTGIVSGGSKTNKSWTLIAIALCVATGTPWLGYRTTQGPVLYLNLELKKKTFHHRVYVVSRALGIKNAKDLHIENLRGQAMDEASLRSNIQRLAKKHKPVLIVVDPFYRLSSAAGVDENSNGEQTRILSLLEEIAETANTALLMVHHFAKGDSASKNQIDRAAGAGALARAPDAVFTLTPHEQDGAMVLEGALRDLPPFPPTVLRWTYPVWTVDQTLDPGRLKTKGGRPKQIDESKVLECLKDGMSNKEWMMASKLKEGSFRNKRDQLLGAGKVRQQSGLYYLANA
ncbi:AAA family ATPase [Nibricoccus sp. IMCC34717]|uniref:AAA family ATPase n=1 Tax=Nibricoccus sp. IMCC34717 TaxID=3034021 RepID=UPI00384D19AE